MKEEVILQARNMWAPFLVGSVIGAGIALLLAPKSGKELRKDIRDLASKAQDSVNETVEKGKELYAETAAAVKGAVEGGKTAYTEEREHYRKAA